MKKILKVSSFILLRHRVQCRREVSWQRWKPDQPPAPHASTAPGTGGVGLAWLPICLRKARAPRPGQLVLCMLEEGQDRTWPSGRVFAAVLAVIFNRETVEAAWPPSLGIANRFVLFMEYREDIIRMYWESNWSFGISCHQYSFILMHSL